MLNCNISGFILGCLSIIGWLRSLSASLDECQPVEVDSKKKASLTPRELCLLYLLVNVVGLSLLVANTGTSGAGPSGFQRLAPTQQAGALHLFAYYHWLS